MDEGKDFGRVVENTFVREEPYVTVCDSNKTMTNTDEDFQSQFKEFQIQEERTRDKHEELSTMVQQSVTDTDITLEGYEILKSQNDQLCESIRNYKLQLQTQRELHASKLSADLEFIEKLGTKSEEFGNVAIEEIQKMTNINKIQTSNIQDLQKEIENAQIKVKNTGEENMKLKTVLQQTLTVSDKTWAQYEILKAKNDDLCQDICDFKAMSKSQTESLVSYREDELEYSEKIRKKDQDLAEATEKLQKLSDTDNTLSATIGELKTKLKQAQIEIESSTEDNRNLKTVLQESQTEADKLWEENKHLKAEVKAPKKSRLRKMFKVLCCCFSSPE